MTIWPIAYLLDEFLMESLEGFSKHPSVRNSAVYYIT
jgi:hypothetical protein